MIDVDPDVSAIVRAVKLTLKACDKLMAGNGVLEGQRIGYRTQALMFLLVESAAPLPHDIRVELGQLMLTGMSTLYDDSVGNTQ